ncbi:nSTAND1 domain-containing NTPase [Jidongwangia harbinensis]|uniref:nSTAND1 domain-containing NTPase n=1 Tax=Jidongwangia harbinensis TaxID=2878561 RepID=UPI001CD91A5D|nr:AAA family ATPase [Jidongwangia harbinensis]MCA2211417.1 helix-turn-helix domain-containing protein [Jidongwangia harbinensis]
MPDEPAGPSHRLDLAGIRTRQEFADALTAVRIEAGLTVRDVGRRTGIPSATLGGYFAGRHLPPLKPADQLRGILAACGISDAAVVDQWQRALVRIRPAPGRRPAGTPAPYRGLESYQPEHAQWFYGREALTESLVGHLVERHRWGGPLVVVGPSGSGKSSLLRAGMIPALRAGRLGLPGSADWPVLLLTPGTAPLRELAGQLAAVVDRGAPELHDALRDDPASVAAMLRAPAEPAAGTGRRAVVVVDQFEEIFAAEVDEGERSRFVAALRTLSEPAAPADPRSPPNEPGSPPAALVVLGLRADFYDHTLRLRDPPLAPALQQAQVVVGPMTATELRQAIVEPARRARLDVEDGLVELLLNDVAPAANGGAPAAHDAGALPLLSHALRATWERGNRGRLTVVDYRGTGRIQGAVAGTAEAAYGALGPAQQRLARRVLLRMVNISDDAADTRRRVFRSELPAGADAQLMLDEFIRQRLITANADRLEVTHEALLLAWPRLREWIDDDRAGLRAHRQLTAAAEAWRDAGRDPHALYRGTRLTAAVEWTAEPGRLDDLNPLEREFLEASADQQSAERRAERRRTRRLYKLVAALTVLFLVAVSSAGYAFRQRAAADTQRDMAVSRQMAITANQLRGTDVSLAMQLSLAAYRVARTPEATAGLLESYRTPSASRLVGPPGVVQSVAVSPDRRLLAAGGADFAVRLWDLTTPGRPAALDRPRAGHTDTVYAVAFSPDGRTLASGSGDRTIRLWDAGRPARAAPPGARPAGTGGTVYALAFSPDGRLLASGGADRAVRLWTLSGSGPVALGGPITGAGDSVHSVAFSPDGRLLAAGSRDRSVRLWDVTNPAAPVALGRPLTGPRKAVFSVAFRPDGHTLVAGSADGTVRLWDVRSPATPKPVAGPLDGPQSWINSVTYSPDGRSLAAASSDGKLWIWDAAARRVSAQLPHPAPVTGAVFLNDRSVASSAADGTVRIWTLPGPTMTGHTGEVFGAVFGAGDRILATAGDDDTARLWNVADPRNPTPLGARLTDASRTDRASGAGALSPDARTLAVGAVDGSVQLWDVADPASPVPIPVRLTGHTAGIQGLSFSPGGTVLAVASDDRTVSLWNLTRRHQPVRLGRPLTGFTNYVYSPAFSPDGRLLAAGSADKTIRLWDIRDPARPVPLGKPLSGPTNYAFAVTFSPDGRTLAVGGADNTVRFWDVADPAAPVSLGRPLGGPSNYVYGLAYSADGRTLAAAAGDGTVWLWNVAEKRRPALIAKIAAHSGAAYSAAFGTDRNVLATSGADGTAQLWNTDPDAVAAYVCAVAGDPVSAAEWAKYVPDLPHRPPCPR